MLTLYYAPRSRASRIVQLLDELDALDKVKIETVGIARADGSSGSDPRNPHPEGKVPLLTDGTAEIWESSAIIQYLCERFPEAGLAPGPEDPKRGPYLSWMAYYGGVIEPVLIMAAAGLEHPFIRSNFRDAAAMHARLSRTLESSPYLLGEAFSAADLLIVSAFTWSPDAVPDVPAIRDWVARCTDRPSVKRLAAFEEKALASA